MEVRPGYKQTEVGVIPEDWQTHTIGDSLRLINGRAFKPEDWKESGFPIVRIQNLNDIDATFNYWPGPIEDKLALKPVIFYLLGLERQARPSALAFGMGQSRY